MFQNLIKEMYLYKKFMFLKFLLSRHLHSVLPFLGRKGTSQSVQNVPFTQVKQYEMDELHNVQILF